MYCYMCGTLWSNGLADLGLIETVLEFVILSANVYTMKLAEHIQCGHTYTHAHAHTVDEEYLRYEASALTICRFSFESLLTHRVKYYVLVPESISFKLLKWTGYGFAELIFEQKMFLKSLLPLTRSMRKFAFVFHSEKLKETKCQLALLVWVECESIPYSSAIFFYFFSPKNLMLLYLYAFLSNSCTTGFNVICHLTVSTEQKRENDFPVTINRWTFLCDAKSVKLKSIR